MALQAGIVGLPNVGKSTLFNAVSNSAKAQASNYRFCTIEPNVGIVEVPDERMKALAAIVHPERTVPASTRFVDIAGIVKGASKGEGLGNKFLQHIRDVDALCHVVRCFVDDNVVHVDGRVDPVRDAGTIETELILADLEGVEKRLDRARKMMKSGDSIEKRVGPLLEGLKAHLENGNPARTFSFFVDNVDDDDLKFVLRELHMLTVKPCARRSKARSPSSRPKSAANFSPRWA